MFNEIEVSISDLYLKKFKNDRIIEKFSAIFIFTLIISGNFLAELFPCKIQNYLVNNIYLKHFFGFFTLFFFGIIVFPELANLSGMVSSIVLYLAFLITAKTNYICWIIIFMAYAFVYTCHIIIKDLQTKIDSKKTSVKKKQTLENYISNMRKIEEVLTIIIMIVTLIGFLIYLGEKKIEYGKNFKLMTFLFGVSQCKNKSPDISVLKSLSALFK